MQFPHTKQVFSVSSKTASAVFRITVLVLVSLSLSLLLAASIFSLSSDTLVEKAHADQVSYMDEAGNIHFVDKTAEVPKEYILQVKTPTPTPYLDKRAQAELKRRQQQAEAQKKRLEREKENDLRRRREQMERERIKEERELRRKDEAARMQR